MAWENLKDLIEKERNEQNNKSSSFLKNTIIFILFLSLIPAGWWMKSQYDSFMNNINNLNNTKEAVFGNVNNDKWLGNETFKVSIAGELYGFNNFEEFKKKIEVITKEIGEYDYTIVWKEWDKTIFEEKTKFKDLGYFINIPQLAEYVKSNIWNNSLSTGSWIVIDLSTYSYMDSKQITLKKDELVNKYVKNWWIISFSTASGFYISWDNYSFYVMNTTWEDIKKVNLSDPKPTIWTIYFSMEKTDINDKLLKLNATYSNIKNLNLSILIPSKNNKKNLEVFKSKFSQYKNEVTNDWLKIFLNWSSFFPWMWYMNGTINYQDIDFFWTWQVRVSASDTNIVVKKENFFDLTNPSLNENYPTGDDFIRIVNDNWVLLDLWWLNSKINEFFKYQLATNFLDKKQLYTILASVVSDNSTSPIVSIDKIVWKTVWIKNSLSASNVFSRKQLYSSATPLTIKDVNKIVDEFHIENLTIGWVEYKKGDTFKVSEMECKIVDIYSWWFSIECPYAETYNLISSTWFEKYTEGIYLKFKWLWTPEDKILFIYDVWVPVSLLYSDKEKDFENLYSALWTYLDIDKSTLRTIKYRNWNFDLYFKENYDWYIKSWPDYDVFLLFLISLK